MRIHYPGTPESLAGKPTLRLDQLEAIYRIVREIRDPGRSKGVLVGAGMGSGKTVVSVEAILKLQPERCLIVGVRDAYSQWAKTMKEQGGKMPILRINGEPDGLVNLQKLINGEPGIFYAGLEMIRSHDWGEVTMPIEVDKKIASAFGYKPGELPTEQTIKKQLGIFRKMKPVDILFSDEAHKHSNQQSSAIDTMESIPSAAIVALSGTFFGNKIINAWSLTKWIWGKSVIGSKTAFEEEFCVNVPIMSKDGRKQLKSPRGFPLSKVVGERIPGAFVETLPCYVFIATPIGDPPDPEIVKVDLSPEVARQYNEMETQSLTWIPAIGSPEYEALVADLSLTQRMRLRTAALGAMTLVPGKDEDAADGVTFAVNCESSTLNAAYEILHRKSWVGKKALILTHSLPFAIETARRIGQKYPTALKVGGVSGKKWDTMKERFMLHPSHPDSIQYLVAVISAVGTAMDGLQANCAKVLWLSEDENNVNNIQGSNRVWREGVILEDYESVKIIQRGTIAERVLEKNDEHRVSVMGSIQDA